MEDVITVRGARQHNLKGITVSVPKGRLTVVTGVSGSGKSSLAFDTLYAEGQRRYVESFSAYARQFLERMDRPDVDGIDGILPAVAIERRNHIRSSRSTVGTVTEIADYLKLLYAHAATLVCDGCGEPVVAEGPGLAASIVQDAWPGESALVCFPVRPAELGGPEIADAWLRGRGFFRVLDGEAVRRLDADATLDAPEVLVIQDRVRTDDRLRLVEAFENAMREGRGQAVIAVGAARRRFTNQLHCARCDRAYAPPVAALFSSNSPVGACPACKGFGRTIGLDLGLCIPDARKSLGGGAIKPWTTEKTAEERRDLARFCEKAAIPMDVPWAALDDAQRRRVVDGEKKHKWYGVRGWFAWLEKKTYRMHVRVLLSRYRAYVTCADCGGRRLRPEALRWRLGGLHIGDLNTLTIEDAARHLAGLDLPAMAERAVASAHREVALRLGYLMEVGLPYLALDRASRTLSGGEAQRVNLTTALGSRLVGTLYVLDEPSVGLHPRDGDRLMRVLREIRDLGNTVVLVEHDEAVIRAADYVIDLGPEAGERGGRLLYQGPPEGLTSAPESATGAFLDRPASALGEGRPFDGWLTVRGARTNNLRGIDVRFPLRALTCVSGVSGSGKSSLVIDTLYRGILRALGQPCEAPGAHDAIEGAEAFDRVVLVDATPVASSPRSNPATFLKAWDAIRKLLAAEDESVRRGFSACTFSFNTPGGRCEVCEGSGFERVEMQFLSDLFLTCEACHGARFQREVLAVRHGGKRVDEVLAMTAEDARTFFSGTPKIARALEPLVRVGLGYLRLGQPLSTLSGGEAQRLKIADGLSERKPGRALYLFDEPTSGLHLKDTALLIENLRALTAAGHTVIVIEHHLDLVRAADHVIDLGPEGGAGGGLVVAEGPPSAIAADTASHTGRFLREAPPPRAPVPPVEATAVIAVRGARVHNLKGIDVAIPREKLTVITGPSGSGKSSLAFDVLFAEGQRRFIDCLSPWARQYLRQPGRPDLDDLTGIPPTVAIEQRTTRSGRRSTVATVTEIYHFLRLLFARVGRQHCHVCGEPVQGLEPGELLARIQRRHAGRRIMLLAPVVKRRKGWHKEVLGRAARLGLALVRVDGKLRGVQKDLSLGRYQEHDVDFVILADHLVRGSPAALRDALGRALDEGHGTVYVRDVETGTETTYSNDLYCDTDSIGFDPPDPRLFSFHGKGSGACATCDGAGTTADGDESLARDEPPCPTCDGTRLSPVARAVRVDGAGIHEVTAMGPGGVLAWLDGLSMTGREARIAEPIAAELADRCRFLLSVGLDYLSLSRSGHTLSGGEAQRVRLAAQLASRLCGVLYVLDEPTIGLHPSDNARLLDALGELRGRGNTVVVVEHDRETMDTADLIVDLGPGGGKDGGRIMAVGTPAELRNNPASLTGRWLSAPEHPQRPARTAPDRFLKLDGVTRHNLRSVSARLPLGRLTVVTGVSGSGKSTLVKDVLVAEVARPTGLLTGAGDLRRAIEVDQSPIGRTPRSTPSTYVGIMDAIRALFASLPESKVRGYGPGRFSFNVSGGRCETCAGQGALSVEMSFLPDAFVPCDACEGRRYGPETLRIAYRGRSIADVLQATVDEALVLFEAQTRIRRPLELMADLGLGYLALGQASNTLSGGEAQRLKLATELHKRSDAATLYVLDEPSTGLHMADLARLSRVLLRLVERGDTVVVIEHNLDVIALADWIVDLGPGGGTAGGRVLYEGAPEGLAGVPESRTAPWLARHVGFADRRSGV